MKTHDYDVAVIGGGPAGLQAALTLGRVHRSVLLLDSGEYRNDAAQHMHNFVTQDGTPPAEFRAAAREQLKAYDTVELRDVRVSAVKSDGDAWSLEAEGEPVVKALKLILATGLRDTLPDRPGLQGLWGDVVAHCPYCHGHEFSGRHVAVLGSGAKVPMLASMMVRIASRVTVLADGEELEEAARQQLKNLRVAVRNEPVTGTDRSAAGATVTFGSGPEEEIGGLFVTTALSQSAPFADQLGLEMLPSGCVRVDELGRTSRPGVYAAGDLAHLAALPMPLASVLNAASAGLLAAVAAGQDLMADEMT